MLHLFADPADMQDGLLTITGSEVNHIRNVLRMKPGDELVPILSCVDAKGRAAVAAGVYRFNSDMKGAVVVSSCNRFDEIADEMQSAEFLRRSVEIAFACEVERFFPYEFADDRPSGGFGLFDTGLRPRSAWKTLRKFTKDYMEAKPLK